jgi:hypothetical protein
MNLAIQGGQLMAKSNVSRLVESRAMINLGNGKRSGDFNWSTQHSILFGKME